MKLRQMVNISLVTVESWWRQGIINDTDFRRYLYAWDWSAFRSVSPRQEYYYKTKGREAFWNRIERTKRRIELLKKGV